jgi:hypothetical protein
MEEYERAYASRTGTYAASVVGTSIEVEDAEQAEWTTAEATLWGPARDGINATLRPGHAIDRDAS